MTREWEKGKNPRFKPALRTCFYIKKNRNRVFNVKTGIEDLTRIRGERNQCLRGENAIRGTS
jgi:hypothetical protein